MSTAPSSYPCPACGAGANLSTGCPRCGRAPDPVAAEVIRLDGEIVALAGRVEQARQAYTALTGALDELRRRRADLVVRIRTTVYANRPLVTAPVPPGAPLTAAPPVAPRPIPAQVGPVPPIPAQVGPALLSPAPVRPEASTRAVQNLLFVLGGLLLFAAAVVFMVVTWSVVGVAGRAAILAGITGLVLALPPLAKRRGLTATAETFSVVGLLLVALDGYAAWSVDLFGVADWSGSSYAALVCGVGATVAAGYRRLTRLRAPWFTALVLAQPVLPLTAASWRPETAGWTLVFAALAGLNLAVLHTTRVEPDPVGVRVGAGESGGAAPGGVALARQVLGWVAYAVALAGAGLCGLAALLVADGPGSPVLAGGPLLVAVAVLVAGAVLARSAGFQAAAGLVVVVSLAGAVLRPVAEWDASVLLVAGGLVVAGLAGAVALTGPRLPAGVRGGPRVGGLLLAGGLGLVVGAMTIAIAYEAVTRSLPVWRGTGTGRVSILDWQVPVTVLLLAVACAVLLPRSARELIGVLGTGLVVLAVPAAVALPWWALAALELTVAALLLVAAVRLPAPGVPTLLVRAGTGTVLTGHAFLLGLARPVSAAAVLGVIVLVGLGIGVLAGPVPGDRLAGVRRAIGGIGLGVGLVAVPGVVTVGLFAAGVAPWWQTRAALASGVLLLGAVVVLGRRRPDHLPYADTALTAAALVTGLSPLFGRTGEPVGLYAAVGVLLLVAALYLTGWLATRPVSATLFGVPVLAFSAVVAVTPAIGAVLLGPYGWLGRIWSGSPAGRGSPRAGGRSTSRPGRRWRCWRSPRP